MARLAQYVSIVNVVNIVLICIYTTTVDLGVYPVGYVVWKIDGFHCMISRCRQRGIDIGYSLLLL